MLENIEEKSGEIAELTTSIKKLEITPTYQCKASLFHRSEKKGFGSLPLYTGFDPTYYWDNSLTQCLIPTEDQIKSASPIVLCVEHPGFQYVGESAPNISQFQFLNYCREYDSICANGQTTLKSKGISFGIVTNLSYEDAHISIEDNFLAVFEFKSPNTSIYANVAQAASYGTNFAMALLNKGLPREHCIVPVIAFNGHTIVFGATIILQETYPTYIPLSKSLDLSNILDSQTASAYLEKCITHCKNLQNQFQHAPSRPFQEMKLELDDKYWVKTIDERTYRGGLGIFHDDRDPKFIEKGLRHMFHSLSTVYNHPEARKYAEYPLSIRTPSDDCKYYQIIYTNLSNFGYNIGAPNLFDDEELFDKYVKALKEAVRQIHDAGVLHCDLYLSNVMWKHNFLTDVVDIKLIDWDCSHTIKEKQFHRNAADRLREYLGREAIFGVEHDNLYLKIFELNRDDYQQEWINLASNNKPLIDEAFYNLFSAVLYNLE